MRDVVFHTLVDMYTTSPRCLGRALGRRGVQPILSTHAHAASYTTSTTRRNRRVLASSTTATSTPTIQGWRRYAAGVQPLGSIAVLGGGLTGLSTAWYLTRLLPQVKITLYEASNRLGGWIDTETVEVQTEDGQKGTVNFERAARMIAPQTKTSNPKWDDLVFFDMVRSCAIAQPCLARLFADLFLPSSRPRSPISTLPTNWNTRPGRSSPFPVTSTTPTISSPSRGRR